MLIYILLGKLQDYDTSLNSKSFTAFTYALLVQSLYLPMCCTLKGKNWVINWNNIEESLIIRILIIQVWGILIKEG